MKRGRLAILYPLSSILVSLTVASCNSTPAPNAPPPGPSPTLSAANQALAAGRSAASSGDSARADRYADDAIADAGNYLRNSPDGPEAAEAFYLQGRGYELRVSSGPTERSENLSGARDAYQMALGRNPTPPLEGDIRSQLSNVAFFQDDFATAISQASQALKLVDSPDVKGSLIFRTGVCQQRLGEWTSADQTFNQVIQKYPGTPIAEAARAQQGQRQFYVQLATFDTPEDAEKNLAKVQASGAIITRRTDARGHTIADIGPYATYADAKKAREQLGGGFPGALIVP